MPGTYQYEPGNIAEYGKDRMRFELGDVMVEGKEKTCALCDEEYNAVIPEKFRRRGNGKKQNFVALKALCGSLHLNPIQRLAHSPYPWGNGPNYGKRCMRI